MHLDINDFQKSIIIKARSVSIAGMDWEDVVQELNLHLLLVKGKYNPARSKPKTFVSRVINNKIRDLIRKAGAKKRNLYKTVSLDAMLDEGFDIATED